MAGYSATPLWQKLGYKPDLEAFADGAPPEYVSLLNLPKEVKVRWLKKSKQGVKWVHLFCREMATLKKKLKQYRNQIAPEGVIWVSWPKKASGVPTDITENRVRDCALPLGLVDIKVCAVDEIWSGLKLMIRKTER